MIDNDQKLALVLLRITIARWLSYWQLFPPPGSEYAQVELFIIPVLQHR